MGAEMRMRVNNKGQAAIETGLALPFLIWLLYYTLNAFHAIHTAHVGQKYAAMNLYQRLDNQAKFAIDSLADQAHGKNYMAVRYMDPRGEAPRRKILLDPSDPVRIDVMVGICKEPGCD